MIIRTSILDIPFFRLSSQARLRRCYACLAATRSTTPLTSATAPEMGGGGNVSFRMWRGSIRCRRSLLLEYLFNLADFPLDFAGEFFVLAFGFQVGVVRSLSGCLFDAAFQFMKLAFDLIFRARFHLVSPLFLSRTFHYSFFRCW